MSSMQNSNDNLVQCSMHPNTNNISHCFYDLSILISLHYCWHDCCWKIVSASGCFWFVCMTEKQTPTWIQLHHALLMESIFMATKIVINPLIIWIWNIMRYYQHKLLQTHILWTIKYHQHISFNYLYKIYMYYNQSSFGNSVTNLKYHVQCIWLNAAHKSQLYSSCIAISICSWIRLFSTNRYSLYTRSEKHVFTNPKINAILNWLRWQSKSIH